MGNNVYMKKAFTMIELLVVMAIMGILTIITVSQFTTAKIKARDAQRKADLSSVSKALLMYYADYSKFPNANAGRIQLNVNEKNDVFDWGGEFSDGTGDPLGLYMKVLPEEDNQSAYPYCYWTDADGSSYAILGHLENDQDVDGYRKDNPNPVIRNISCNGVGGYNYGFTSPNTSLDEIDTAM